MSEIKATHNGDGKISQNTMRAIFEASMSRTPSLKPEHWIGFLVGMRCFERMINDCGVPTLPIIDGRTFIDPKVADTPTDTDR